MKLSLIADEGDVVHVRCEEEITNVYPRGDREPLESLLGPAGLKRKVLLNLEQVTFLDSSGISWLLIRHKHIKEHGGRLVLYEVPQLVLQMLEFLRLPQVLFIATNEAAARALAAGA
jgi:stage II sporulation protein AA (anti-sigma F factor antagonist)